MVEKKNKKKKLIRPLNIKGFPGYDFHITIVMFILIVVLATCMGCHSPDTVYVREYYHSRPFGASLHIHHSHHYDHHHHRHGGSRRHSKPVTKTITPTRTPPPPRPISKGVPEPPTNPRERR